MPKRTQTPDTTKLGVQHPKAKPDCPLCAGRGWAILVRPIAGDYPQFEGLRAVQRCDDCAVFKSDIEAAKRAHQVGIYARFEYPCVLLSDIEPVAELEYLLWHDHPPVPLGKDSPFSTDPDRGSYFHENDKELALRKPLSQEKRHFISTKAIHGLINRSNELAEKLKKMKKRDRDALLLKWKLGFLGMLIATWHAWGESESRYVEWLRDHHKFITKKFGSVV